MAKERQRPNWFDFSVAAISPVLIMGLVGSLAFFLLDVLYGGDYVERLIWTVFFFVVGAVLVARIAIVVDPKRAQLYALVLGVSVFLALLKFFPAGWLINLVVVGVVLWSATKLVWNCTFLDEDHPDPGLGLLADMSSPPRKRRASKSPGISVIYFTLAAFPLFALGQSLIPAAELARRRFAFLMMTVYVACGLGLLMTTALLGLRRYLRQRRLSMPASLTGLWLAAGAILIALVLAVGAFFPRPYAEYSLISASRIGAESRSASSAGHGDQAGEGEGRPGAKGKGEGQQGSGQGNEGGQASGKSGKPEGGSGGDKGSGGQKGREGDQGGNQGQGRSDSSSAPPSSSLPQWFTNGLKWAVLVMLGIPVTIFLLVFVLRRLDSLPAWLQRWLDAFAAWWQSLFSKRQESETDAEIAEVVTPRPRPFRSFSNPFSDGSAAGRSPDELVRYTFAALEAWAIEQGSLRRDDETPLEFGQRLGAEFADLAEAAPAVSTHYANLAYGRRRVPERARPQIEQLWLALDALPAAVPVLSHG